jgi:hypothetical protein
MDDVGPGQELEQLAGEVMRRAGAGRRVVVFARVALGLGNEVRERLRRDLLGVHHHDVRHLGDDADRHEVLLEIVGERGVHRRRDHMMGRADEEGVSVRGRLGGRRGPRIAPGAGAVVDDDAHPELVVELLRQGPGERIGAAARREGHDERNRPLRPGLGQGRGGGGRQGRKREDARDDRFQGASPRYPALAFRSVSRRILPAGVQ